MMDDENKIIIESAKKFAAQGDFQRAISDIEAIEGCREDIHLMSLVHDFLVQGKCFIQAEEVKQLIGYLESPEAMEAAMLSGKVKQLPPSNMKAPQYGKN